jgi:hypothetical protein
VTNIEDLEARNLKFGFFFCDRESGGGFIVIQWPHVFLHLRCTLVLGSLAVTVIIVYSCGIVLSSSSRNEQQLMPNDLKAKEYLHITTSAVFHDQMFLLV